MDHMMAVIYAMSNFLWITSDADIINGSRFHMIYQGVPQDITGQELVISTRSKVDCAVQCRRHPQCNFFAFDKHVIPSSCYLNPETSWNNWTVGSATNKTLVVYQQNASYPGCYSADIANSTVAVATHLSSAGRLEARCTNDYYPQGVSAYCLPDGKWSPSDFRCLKRIWRYPKTDTQSLPIPGTVVPGWSVCIEGVPTVEDLFALEICEVCENNIPIHTSWRFKTSARGAYLAINEKLNNTWATETAVTTPPFPLVVRQPFAFILTVNTTNTVHITLNFDSPNDFTFLTSSIIPPEPRPCADSF